MRLTQFVSSKGRGGGGKWSLTAYGDDPNTFLGISQDLKVFSLVSSDASWTPATHG